MAFSTKQTWISIVALPLLAACSAAGGESTESTNADEAALSTIQIHPTRDACDRTNLAPGFAACHAKIRTDVDPTLAANTAPQGFGPSDLASAYKIPSSGGSGVTVAIIDAQDDPNAEADLGVYRKQYGLSACTTANGCFKKVNEKGAASPLPTADTGWAGEISLDVDMVSAACPSCKILLVEATSSSMSDLGAAVNAAVKLGATVVSNSYGGGESSSDTSADTSDFTHPGVAIFASNGDDGYGVEYPAASPDVIAVGGTSLVKSSTTRGWTEGVWKTSAKEGTGSGCSKYESKPSWQKDTGCTKRTVGDTSAVADPNTGVAVYQTYGASGWSVYGGTSVASPLVASIFAKVGLGGSNASVIYAHTSSFNDVTSGSNGTCSSKAKYLCTAETGYDGPTGVGTPNGTSLAGL